MLLGFIKAFCNVGFKKFKLSQPVLNVNSLLVIIKFLEWLKQLYICYSEESNSIWKQKTKTNFANQYKNLLLIFRETIPWIASSGFSYQNHVKCIIFIFIFSICKNSAFVLP